MDEEAVGAQKANMNNVSSAETADHSGPLEQRVVNSNWSVRFKAYDEIREMSVKAAIGDKLPFMNEYAPMMKTFLADKIAGAYEKALELFQEFVKKIPKKLAQEHHVAWLGLLAEKGLGHAKATCKDKAKDAINLLFATSELFEDSGDALLALASHKNVKNLTSGTLAIAYLIKAWGPAKAKAPMYFEQMLKNAQSTNPGAKTAAYEFYKSIYFWQGEEKVMEQISEKLKPAQIGDLKKLFAKVQEEIDANGGKKDKLIVRDMLAKQEELKQQEKEEELALIRQAEEEKKKQEQAAFDALPELDLKEYGPDWQDGLDKLEKWEEKHKAMEEMAEKLQPMKVKKGGNHEALFKYLKKQVEAKNMNFAIAAAKILALLAEKMKKDFAVGAKESITAIMGKYKEKRPKIVQELDSFSEHVCHCTNLEEIRDEIIPCISDKAPGVKLGTCKFLAKIILVTYIDVLKRVADDLMPPLLKTLDDKDGGVRDTAARVVGILKGRLGADYMEKHLAKVVKQKVEKIDEASKEVQPSVYDKPEGYKEPVKKKKVEKPVVDDDEDALMNFDNGPPKRAPPKNIGKAPPKKPKPGEVKEEEKGGDDEDALMTFDNDAPKRAPPKNIGKAPPKRPKPGDEPKEESKGPALSSGPAKSGPKGPTKDPSGPKIVEEDLGAGLSPEQAEDKCTEFYDGEIVTNLGSDKWKEQHEAGFTPMFEEIKNKEMTSQMCEATVKFIKGKTKGFKTSQMPIIKDIIQTFQALSELDCMEKRAYAVGAEFFIDKIGEMKYGVPIKTMMLTASEVVSPKFVATQVIKYGAKTKAPNNIAESCNVIVSIIEEFGGTGIPLKESIDLGSVACANSNKKVRDAAMKLFCELYKHLGEALKTFMGEIKASTLKEIETAFGKVTQYGKGEYEPKRQLRGQALASQAAAAPAGGKKGKGGGGGGGVADLLGDMPREDISKKLNSKLFEKMKAPAKEWKKRVDALTELEGILKAAGNRIETTGLNELMDNMKQGMKDPNKAALKSFIQMLGLLADCIGEDIKKYTKKCLVPMLDNISYKDTLVRANVVTSMNKWADNIGPALVINQLGPVILDPNPEARSEGMTWILKNTSSVTQSDMTSLIKPLLACLNDKSKALRDQAEEIISLIMPEIGYGEFTSAIKVEKAAVQQTLKPILDRIKGKCGAGGGGNAEPAEEKKETKTSKTAAKTAQKTPVKEEKKEPPKNSFAKAAAAKAAPTKKNQVEEDELTINVLNKTKRSQIDGRTRYPVGEAKGDHVDQLRQYCEQIFGQKFSDQMFAKATDFNKHIKCCERILQLVDVQPDQMMEIVDILFKWTNLRMTESTNTQLLKSIYDLYEGILKLMNEREYTMMEFEALVIIGSLCDRSGHNIAQMKDAAKKIIRICFENYDNKEAFRTVINAGIKSQTNLKAVAECLDELVYYIQNNDDGISFLKKSDYELILKKLDLSDKSVRENCLRVFSEVYKVHGEGIWAILKKDIPLKVKGLLEQRFKTLNKGGLNMSMNSNGGGKNKLASQTIGGKSKLGDSINKNKLNSSINNKNSGLSTIKPVSKNKLDASMKSGRSGSRSPRNNNSSKKLSSSIKPKEPEEMVVDQVAAVQSEVPSEAPNVNMQDVFQGKASVEQNEPNKEDVVMEEDSAQVVNQGKPALAGEQPQAIRASMKKDLETHEFEALVNEVDPELREPIKEIRNHIQLLVNGDLLKKVDALVKLHDTIALFSAKQPEDGETPQPPNESQQLQQRALLHCVNEMVDAFTLVMNEVFSNPIDEIPLRFTKYFITILTRACSQKEIMRKVALPQVVGLVEQLLTRLLIENLDKIGSNSQNNTKEGELILKNLNSSMLRMLENCQYTLIFDALLTLLAKYKDDPNHAKVPSLIMKCLLKLSKNMDKIIEKLDLKKFLLSIHTYVLAITASGQANANPQGDDLYIRIAKTLIHETVRIKGESIWDYFSVIEEHPQNDQRMKKWILIILKNQDNDGGESRQNTGQPTTPATQSEHQPNQSRIYIEIELKRVIQELKDPSKYESGLQKLDKFERSHPGYDYQKSLLKESQQFCNKVLQDLDNFKNGKGPSNSSTQNSSSLGGMGSGGNKFISKRNSNVAQINQIGQQQKLNTSFRDRLQNSERKGVLGGQLSNRFTASASTNNLAQTMGPGGMQQRLSNINNPLNTSNNAFKDRLKNKIGGNKDPNQGSLGAQQDQVTRQSHAANQGIGMGVRPQTNNLVGGQGQGLGNSGGISTNSFRDRLQGLKSRAAGGGTAQQPGQTGDASASALQNKLAALKAQIPKK